MGSTYSFDNSWTQAQARLAALEARFDPGTIGHLERLGVGKGWRCLEVGAGEGRVFLRRPGADSVTARLTAEQLKADLQAAGSVSEAEYGAYLQLLEDPAFLAQTAVMVAAWGRRDPGGQRTA